MALNTNFNTKPSLVKPVIIAVAVLLVIGGAYTFFGKSSKSDSANDETEYKSSGLDQDKKIRNVGDVEEVMAKWIEANPQAIINSVANMQRKAMEDQVQNAQKNIGPKKDELFNDANSPVYAPKGYDVTIVEFFDYNCGYCKKSNATIETVIKDDGKVRVIYKEFPILGPSSEEISTIALAVHLSEPALYKKFHDALMNSNAASKEEAMKVAKNVGVNTSKLESTIKSQKDKISAIINKNRSLGASIGVQGTPGFVIGEELIPGAIGADVIKEKIATERKKK